MRNLKLLISLLIFAMMFSSWQKAMGQSKQGAKKPNNEFTKVKVLVNGKSRIYYELNNESPTNMGLIGPGKLKLYTRAHFANKKDKSAKYTIAYSLNEGEEQFLNVESEMPSSNSTYPEGVLGLPGKSKRFEIDVPIGTNQFSFRLLTNNKPVAVRYIFNPVKVNYDWINYSPRKFEEAHEIVTNEIVSFYYKYSRSIPLQISANGPTQIMVFTRLGFDHQMSGKVNFRVQVKENGKLINTFQLSNRQSDVSIFKELKEITPGKASKFVIYVPEGRHTYDLIPMEIFESGVFSKFMIIKDDVSNTK